MTTLNRIQAVSHIKDKICDVSYKRNVKLLPELLSLFAQQLSPRRISGLEDINCFFDQLDRLNLGSVNNLWAFIRIAEYLQDEALSSLVREAGKLDIPEQHFHTIGQNLYALRRTRNLPPVLPDNQCKSVEDLPAPSIPNPVLQQPPENLQEKITESRVFDLLACELGRRWRDMGRSLGFHEADLDEFEDRHRSNLKERIYSMLQEYARGHSSHQELMNGICGGLNQCRRVDLRKKIQQLMNRR